MAIDRVDDLIITVAYFSIPLQIAVSLCRYPRLSHMPISILVLVILFALFIFLCGTGHLMRCYGATSGTAFGILNGLTALISLTTALYLLPLVPTLMGTLDKGLIDLALKEEVEVAQRKLMTFMAFLCHEIRNPLFAITSTVSLLEEGEEMISPAQDRALRSINHSAFLMLRIVNDVLDLGKLESGKLELEQRCFDIKDVFQTVVASTESLIERKHKQNVRFIFEMSDNMPQIVCGDSARLLQIVYNLLSNATKFTEEGHVHFKVSVIEKSQKTSMERLQGNLIFEDSSLLNSIDLSPSGKSTNKQTSHSEFPLWLLEVAEAGQANIEQASDSGPCETVVLKMTISDSGPGIPKESIHQIFEPYSQSKLSDFRKHGGTGLGLAIITKLVKVMGGTIKIHSVIGEGSTFTVCVPVLVPIHSIATGGIIADGLNPCSTLDYNLLLEAEDKISSAKESFRRTWASQDHQTGTLESERDEEKSLESLSTVMLAPVPALVRKKLNLPKFNFPHNEGVVLVVDDNPMNCKLITKMLALYDVQHETACNGQVAVDIMSTSRNVSNNMNAPLYGLILMDMQMPVLDGCEATKILRQRLNVTIPIVALTANALDQHRSLALEAGATEFATKPITLKDLHAKCCKYLQGESIQIS